MFQASANKARAATVLSLQPRADGSASATPLQRLADGSPYVRCLNVLQRFADAGPAALQRQVYLGGGGVTVTSAAKAAARRARLPRNHVNGSKHVPQIPTMPHLMGYTFGGSHYVGGMIFNNNAMPDGNKLPYRKGQTYQEWDVHPFVAGQNRGPERVITGSDGTSYYTSDHYANFTRIS